MDSIEKVDPRNSPEEYDKFGVTVRWNQQADSFVAQPLSRALDGMSAMGETRAGALTALEHAAASYDGQIAPVVRLQSQGERYVVFLVSGSISARLDPSTIRAFNSGLREEVENGTRSIILDMTSLLSLSAEGIGALVGASRALRTSRAPKRQLYLVSDRFISRVLAAARLAGLFQFYADVPAAIAAASR